jgi:DNA-directed RNA polymerase subunit alpha
MDDNAPAITVDEIIAKDTWTAEDHRELQRLMFATGDAPGKLRSILRRMEAEAGEIKGAPAVKIGIARYMLCRFREALEALNAGTDNKDRRYFQALCHKSLRQYDAANEEFQRAVDRGWDADEIACRMIEVQALGGNLDDAKAALGKLNAELQGSADAAYCEGLIAELEGRGADAIDGYEKARQREPEHPAATFRLAYFYDLHGEEDAAIELYNACISRPPVHASALMNLAVLHEDAGRYDQAIGCLRSILLTDPNHERAKLFLKDAEASKTMYYDEDQARRIARRNAVLDIPVTDFELSVRARNCLKKMNIRTLGDLVRTGESELLSYKNFGETSLKEIKDMLSAKGLHLGQALEEDSEMLEHEPEPFPLEEQQTGVAATPIAQVEFSVRARRALEELGIQTLGDLAARNEPELLTCRNFGQTSLNEVRQRLAEYGMQLRES